MGHFEIVLTSLLFMALLVVSVMYITLASKYLSLEKAAKLAVKVLEQQAEVLEKHSLSKSSAKFAPEVKKEIGKKLSEVVGLNKQQMDLIRSLDAPSSSALHSKYKNDVMRQCAELDVLKNKAMQDVVDLGYDPEVTTVDGYGQTKRATFSSILKGNADKEVKEVKVDIIAKPKLTLIKTIKETKDECTEQNPQG